jgi:streptogramin lyase
LPGSIESWETTPARPYDVVVLSDGTPWFATDDVVGGPVGNTLVTVDPQTEAITVYPLVDTPPLQFQTLAVDANDVLWIAETNDRLVRFDPATAAYDIYTLPSPPFASPASPFGVSVAADGMVWFTCWSDLALGRFDPVSETFDRFPSVGSLPDPPVEIAFDSGGILYFTIRRAAGSSPGLGRLDPGTGMFDFWLNPYANAFQPFGIVRVGDVFWFLDHAAGPGDFGNFIVRFDPATEMFQETKLPLELIDPHFLVADQIGRLWFPALVTSRLGRFDPRTSTFDWADIPGSPVGPLGIAGLTSRDLWIAETGSTAIGGGLVNAGVGRYRDEFAAAAAPSLGAAGLAVALSVLAVVGLAALRRARNGTV